MRLKDMSAVITGGASGLGRAACLAFAAEGARVVVADLDEDGAGAVAAEVEQKNGTAVPVRVDVTSEDDVREMVDAALRSFGTVDCLYANAGIEAPGSAHELTLAEWDRALSINLTGVWLSMRAVLPVFLDNGGGTIIAQASVAALVGQSGLAAYSAAKGGVTALTRQVAVEYGRHGIRANTICPGLVPTPLVTRTYEQQNGDAVFGDESAMHAAAARRFPLRRLGRPEDVANLAVYLASPESGWITGGVFAADGGLTAQ